MKIAILNLNKSFLPEIHAYKRHLEKRGHTVIEERNPKLLIQNDQSIDLVIRFAGLLREIKGSKIPEIHNYNSASTGRHAKIKNIIKSKLSSKPVGRIFLNETVRSQFNFSDSAPYIFRDMGADESFYNRRENSRKEYDAVYCGSITGRPGLLPSIQKLCSYGIRIGLAGKATKEETEAIKTIKNLNFVGPISYESVAEFISSGHFGLNYCPNIYPFNIQTSTKAIEYLAAGIGIISNNYSWINAHSKEHNYNYLDIDKIKCPDDLHSFNFLKLPETHARTFEWDNVLRRSGFCELIESTINS